MFVNATEAVISITLIAMTAGLYSRRKDIEPRHIGFDLLIIGLVLIGVAILEVCLNQHTRSAKRRGTTTRRLPRL